MKINKILIANRGEIACRIIKTCSLMGIETVAVYSDADKDALYVEMADEAIYIGKAEATESYLDFKKIIKAAKNSGADAVHPGYGFLSENNKFVDALEKENISFIGSSSASILSMGDKSKAKALMEKAGVPLLQGYHGEKQDEIFLLKQAQKIGFPVIIKATAGGGGKAMRIVKSEKDFSDALSAAKREGKSSFGNDVVLIEKYLQEPRHVEIQIFADKLGNIIYLSSRDCSVQRRHQKIIEEAPAPNLSAKTYQKMGEAAKDAAKAINYTGAGTIEFLLDKNKDFYFMEMNTRLQVEHTVTEFITGLDLVEWQIKVAEGQELPIKNQEDIKIAGNSFEVRIYAEDPQNNFIPCGGQIKFLSFPLENENIRIDSGVREEYFGDGDIISSYYDPMIAKIITYGVNRDEALQNMQQALDNTYIAGFKTNLNFLRVLVKHKEFKKTNINTNFIIEYESELLPKKSSKISNEVLALACIGILKEREQKSSDPWDSLLSWRIGGNEGDIFIFKDDMSEYKLKVSYNEDYSYPIITMPDNTVFKAYYEALPENMSFYAQIEDKTYEAVLYKDGNNLNILYEGRNEDLIYLDPLHKNDSEDNFAGKLTAPMPGKVVAVRVKIGSKVKKGDALVIVEAMKMEHTVTSPSDGIIEAVNANIGDQVTEKYELVSLKAS